jgi:peptidoglycan/LPS O-acetylase OafA/YrhL
MAAATGRAGPQPPRYFPSLTALRGVAALCVVLFHYTGGAFPNLHVTEATFFVGKSYVFVDLFFALSGFILMHVHGRALADRPDAAATGAFLWARFARLYPLHLAVLGGFVLLEVARLAIDPATAFGGTHTLATLPASMLLLQAGGIYSTLTWNGPSWSISAEWIACLAFLLLVPLVARLRPAALAVLYVATVLGLAWLSSDSRDLDLTYDWGVPRCLLGLIGGMVLYRGWQHGLPRWIGSDAVAAGTMAAIAAALHFNLRGVLVVPLFGLLILSLADNQGRVGRVLARRPLLALGEMSYALYLAQALLMESVFLGWQAVTGHSLQQAGFTPLQSLAVIGLLIATLLLIAALLHRWIERPAQRRLRRLAPLRPLHPALGRPG